MVKHFRSIPVIDEDDPVNAIHSSSLELAKWIDTNLMRRSEGLRGFKGEKGDTGDVTPEALAAAERAVEAKEEATRLMAETSSQLIGSVSEVKQEIQQIANAAAGSRDAAAKNDSSAWQAAQASMSYLAQARDTVSKKADLVNGKVPASQLPEPAVTPEQVQTAISNVVNQLPESHYRCGTASQRNAWNNPPYFAIWQDIDGTKKRYWYNGSRWQLLFGKSSVMPSSTFQGSSPVFYQNIEFTLPVVLSANETVAILAEQNNGRFTAMSLRSISKNSTDTKVQMTLTQFHSQSPVQMGITWQVIPEV